MKRVLIVRYRKLGDALMVTPVLQSLQEAGAQALFTVAEASSREVFTHHPAVQGHVDISGPEPRRLELIRAGLKARAFRCDTALLLRFSRRAGLVAKIAGCKTIAGALSPDRYGRTGSLNVNAWEQSWPDLHQVEKYYRVAEAVAGPLPRYPTQYHPKTRVHLPPHLAVVHVGNGGSNHGWSDAAYAAVVKGLQAQGLTVAVTGAPADIPLHPQTRAAANQDLVGQTPLDHLAAVFQSAQLVVGLDGGAARLASAVATPVVVLSIGQKWDLRHVQPWMAPGEIVEPILRCSHCSLGHCDNRGQTCVDNLTPDRVLAAAGRILSKSRPLTPL